VTPDGAFCFSSRVFRLSPERARLQFPAVRVPLPIAIVLCFGVIGGVWWAGTRRHDFLTPPSETRLAAVRERASDLRSQPLSTEENPTTQAVKPILVSSVRHPQEEAPELAQYRDQAADPASLLATARQLEAEGKLQRSLLAWERILDSTTPDGTLTSEALQAIKRLRPSLSKWNVDPAQSIAITLRAGADKNHAEALAPALNELASQIENASSGILKVTAETSAGPDSGRQNAPIAMWLTGTDQAISSEVTVFMSGAPGPLEQAATKAVFQIITTHLFRHAGLHVPPFGAGDRQMEFLQTHITRLAWLELGKSLNKSLEQSGISPTR